jgi:hypothetical protein
MRFALLVFLAPLVSTSPAGAQSIDRLEPLPALPATPEPSPTPSAPPATPEPPPVAPPPVSTEGRAAAPGLAPAATSPCPCSRYRHQGFYLGIGTGIGYMSAWGDGPSGSASISGLATLGVIAIGGTLTKGLVLAGAIQVGSAGGTFHGGTTTHVTTTIFANGSPVTNTFTATGASVLSTEIGALIDWYPDPEAGWHMGFSLGVGSTQVTDDGGNVLDGSAFAGSLFGGYQWWLGPGWSLGLQGVLLGATKSSLQDSNQDTGYAMMPLSIGVQTLLLAY